MDRHTGLVGRVHIWWSFFLQKGHRNLALNHRLIWCLSLAPFSRIAFPFAPVPRKTPLPPGQPSGGVSKGGLVLTVGVVLLLLQRGHVGAPETQVAINPRSAEGCLRRAVGLAPTRLVP